jgi:4-hydroxybenzoate polyprenyltransferase/phosphoserine phosphatase
MYDASSDLPLCVDLDGTLIKSDLLAESALELLGRHPLTALLLPLWLLHGRSHLKEQIANRVHLDVATLPYRSEFLAYLTKEHDRGRILVLTTASHRVLADQIARHLGMFDRVLATEDGVNLAGENKRRRLVEVFGERGFIYAGNERRDLEVWRGARQAILVDVSARVARRVQNALPVAAAFAPHASNWRQYLRALRMHQWLKNILLFLPVVAAHRLGDLTLAAQSVVAFLAFSLCASSVYVLNDLLDLSSDRTHPRKCARPFASGSADIRKGILLVPLLLAAALGLALTLPPLFATSLAGYYAATAFYSMYAKRRVVVDVMLLAALYTVRILAGAAAIAVTPSFWLLAFSMFIFLSLALVKRYAELIALGNKGRARASGRGYMTADLPVLQSLGTASGYISVLVLALYINSPDISRLYHHPMWMWLICPLLLFWISRVWLKAQRAEMHDDPIVWSVADRQSRLIGLCSLLVVLSAT